MKVLIVDDNAMNLKLLRVILESDGHTVVLAHDGEQALTTLGSTDVDAIISDILMPNMDGYRLCFEVRSNTTLRTIPFVFYTAAYTSPADEKLCTDLGADAYVRKPAASNELLATLKDAVAAPRRQPTVTMTSNDVLKEYSERLVDKLEEKNVELSKKADELSTAHLQLHTLLAHSPAVIYTLGLDGEKPVPTMVSDNMERLLGIAGKDTSFDWWVSSLHPDDRDRVVAAKRVGVGQHNISEVYRIHHVDGTYRWIQDDSNVIRDDDDKALKLVGVWTDITKQKEIEEALQLALSETERKVGERTATLAQRNDELLLAKENADQANRSKSEFLSRMSHELRTPMNSILGFGQLLEFSKVDDGQRDCVDHILKAGRHLLRLINEVLEIARIEAESITVSLEPVDLAEVIDECISLMRPAAQQQGITLESAIQGPAVAYADRQRISQVLLNLVSNAIKYNVLNGSINIRIAKASDGFAVVEVADTGIGIADSMLHKLYVPFERLSAGETNIEGTGLGLTLSKSLVEAMGGELSLETKEGAGSTFRVRLKLAANVPVPETLAPASIFEHSVWDGLSGRVLVIEDNLMNTELLKRMFAKCPQIELITTMQGSIGLQLALDSPPDVVLLDLHLPDMTGRQVLAAMREAPSLHQVPVIVVTADAFSDQSKQLMEAGAFRFLSKPFVLSELIAAVAAALEIKRGN